MRTYIYIISLIMGFIITSCSSADAIENNQLESNKVTLNIKTKPITRIGNTTETVTLSRYVMEIWEDANCTIPANVFDVLTTPTNRETVTDGVFTVNLERNKSYTCLFWADNNGENTYDVTNLQAVKLQSGIKPIEAYSTTLTINSIEPTRTIMLNRAIAKVTFGEKDYIPANSTLNIEYKQNTLFNVLTQLASSEEICTETISIPNEINGTATTPYKFGSFYTLAGFGDTGKRVAKMKVKLNNEMAYDIDNIPLQANHNTNVIFEYCSTTSRTFNFNIDSNWGPDDINTDFN